METGKVNLPLYRAVKTKLANTVVDAIDAMVYKFTSGAIVLSFGEDLLDE